LLQQLTSLQDSIDAYRDYFIGNTSLKEYKLQRRLARVIFQGPISVIEHKDVIELERVSY